jgi:hypothetical protein
VGHKSTHVTETVYRHVIVPAIRGGATVMDQVFGDTDGDGQPGTATTACHLVSHLILKPDIRKISLSWRCLHLWG